MFNLLNNRLNRLVLFFYIGVAQLARKKTMRGWPEIKTELMEMLGFVFLQELPVPIQAWNIQKSWKLLIMK